MKIVFLKNIPDMNKNGASPAKHWTPIASPSNSLIHWRESQP